MTKATIRRVKLQSKHQPRQTAWNGTREVPWLNLIGVWLEQAGFKTGDQVEITVIENTLVIKNCKCHGTPSH